ncbi:MAG: hypothetical protein V1722_03935 [Candidatus Micrarchaeota archaeon]
MDFTFLFITVLMVLAAQSGMLWVAVGLFLLLLLSAKSKMLLIATVIGAVLIALVSFGGIGNNYLIIGGLFVIMLIIVKKDADSPQQPDQMAMYGGYGG